MPRQYIGDRNAHLSLALSGCENYLDGSPVFLPSNVHQSCFGLDRYIITRIFGIRTCRSVTYNMSLLPYGHPPVIEQ